MSTTLLDARQRLFAAALHIQEEQGGDTPYNAYGADVAIQDVLSDLVEATRCTETVASFTIPASTSTINLTSATVSPTTFNKSDFRKEHVFYASIDKFDVQVEDIAVVHREYRGDETPSGRPDFMAFEGPTAVTFDKQTDAGYTLRVWCYEPLVAWEAGTDDPGSVTLNVPDQYLFWAIRFGCAPAMVYGDPNSLFSDPGWQRYMKMRDDLAGRLDAVRKGRRAVGQTGGAS